MHACLRFRAAAVATSACMFHRRLTQLLMAVIDQVRVADVSCDCSLLHQRFHVSTKQSNPVLGILLVLYRASHVCWV